MMMAAHVARGHGGDGRDRPPHDRAPLTILAYLFMDAICMEQAGLKPQHIEGWRQMRYKNGKWNSKQAERDLTHPTQSCFMSSVDLHTHYSYQIMLPEAIAVVIAPTDESCPHGIFHLSDPGGVNLIRNCDQRGFHPHEESDDGSPIY